MSREKAVYLSDLHFEHKLWINQLSFCQDELAIYERRLGELVIKYTDTDVLARLEQFQNQFIRQKEVIDQLMHDVNKHEQELSQFATEHPIAIDHVHFKDHTELRDRMDRFNDIYADLKKDFMQYLRKWM